MDNVQLRVRSDGEVDVGAMAIHENVHVSPDVSSLVEDPRLEMRMLGNEPAESFSDVRAVHLNTGRAARKVTERMTQDDDGHGA